MAGAMRKMAVYLGLVEDHGDDTYDDYDDYDSARRSARETRPSTPRGYDDRYDRPTDDRYSSGGGSVRPITTDTRAVRTFRSDAPPPANPTAAPQPSRRPAGSYAPAADISRIETIHPRSYNDARRIGEEYREGVPVIMNLSELADPDAKRIIDFAAGLVFGLHGKIDRITNKVFLLSPANVDVGDMARAQVANDTGFFNQS
jgi:cell division inhibitor SepF